MQETHDLRMIDIGKLSPMPDQPRAEKDQGEEFTALVESVKAEGILQPLLVRPGNNGGYVLVAGERRLRAAQAAGLKSVPCTVREDLSAQQAFELALKENLLRKALSPVEEGKAFQRLNDEFGQSSREIARRYGLSHTLVNNRITLAAVNERIQKEVERGKRTVTEAVAIAKAASPRPARGNNVATRSPGNRRPRGKPHAGPMEKAVRTIDEARKNNPKLKALQAKALLQPPAPLGEMVTITDLHTRAEEVLEEVHRRGQIDVKGHQIRISSLRERAAAVEVDEKSAPVPSRAPKPPLTNY